MKVFSDGPISLESTDSLIPGRRIVLGLPGFLGGCDVFEGLTDVNVVVDYQFDYGPDTTPTWDLFAESLWLCVQELIKDYYPTSFVLCGDSMGLALSFLLAAKVPSDLTVSIVGRRVPFFGRLRPRVMDVMGPIIDDWAARYPRLKKKVPLLPDSEKALRLYEAAPKSNVQEDQLTSFQGELILVSEPFDALHPRETWDYLLELMPHARVAGSLREAIAACG
jgi:hypothetical protein